MFHGLPEVSLRSPSGIPPESLLSLLTRSPSGVLTESSRSLAFQGDSRSEPAATFFVGKLQTQLGQQSHLLALAWALRLPTGSGTDYGAGRGRPSNGKLQFQLADEVDRPTKS